MEFAFLFNSDHENYGGFYGDPIRDIILQTDVLQACNLPLQVRLGDVLIYSSSRNESEYYQLCESTYFASKWKKLRELDLRNTFLKATVYAWVISGLPLELADSLHKKLIKDPSYLGAHSVELSNKFHYKFYRHSMIYKYEINGRTCVLPEIFEPSEAEYEISELKELGFGDVKTGQYLA
jgi:hypothetical protein